MHSHTLLATEIILIEKRSIFSPYRLIFPGLYFQWRECSLSAGEIIVCRKFLVLRRERQALLRIMLPIGKQCWGYVRQITVPHHHTTGGFIHESVRHKQHTHKQTGEKTHTHTYGHALLNEQMLPMHFYRKTNLQIQASHLHMLQILIFHKSLKSSWPKINTNNMCTLECTQN